MRRLALTALLLAACSVRPAPLPGESISSQTTVPLVSAIPTTAVMSRSDRVVGDAFVVREAVDAPAASPRLDQRAAEVALPPRILAEAGPLSELVERGALFAPALMLVTGPSGGPVFESPSPVSAWVVEYSGRKPEGSIYVVGVVDATTGEVLTVATFGPNQG